MDFAILYRGKNKIKWKDRQIFESYQKAEKVLECGSDNDTNHGWLPWNNSPLVLGKQIGGNRDDPVHSTVKIS